MILYRPVGLQELRLIAEKDYRAFPPRLPEQPIFYPVLNIEYARRIARDWNTDAPDHVGFVTRFTIDDDFASRYPVQVVGSRGLHEELWIPASDLEALNASIVGQIEVIESYAGSKFEGQLDPETHLPAGWRRARGALG